MTLEQTLLFLLFLDCYGGGDTNQDVLEQAICCWKFPMVLVKGLTLIFLCSRKLLLTQKPHIVGLLCPSSEGMKMQPVTFVLSTGANLEDSGLR